MSDFVALNLPETNSKISPLMTAATNALIRLPSFCLVLASTGFGAVYAWQAGMQNGVALACLSVLMATGLECAKPLAFSAAMTRGASAQSRMALGLMAFFAVAYSLSAEVSLVATNRQSSNAQRAQITANHDKAKADIETAKADLAALGAVTPLADAEK